MTKSNNLTALKINSDTYPIYKTLPLMHHYDLVQINGQFIVFDSSLPNGRFGYFSALDFDEWYRFDGEVESNKLTPVIPVERND